MLRFLVLALLAFLPFVGQANENFNILKNAKKIVFLGDSITYGGEYVIFFERWLTVNHPELNPEVLNQGIPSATVSGLSEPGHIRHGFPRPDMHERLDRALKALEPDLIIACYGINCGIYMPLDGERFAKYKEGVQRLKKKAEAQGAKVVFMTPPVYDKPNPKILVGITDGRTQLVPGQPSFSKRSCFYANLNLRSPTSSNANLRYALQSI